MARDPNMWKVKAIVEGLPRDLLEPLLDRDGTSISAPFVNSGYVNSGGSKTRPSWMYALGLVGGAGGAHPSGVGWAEWLTPLGQAVVDEMKSQ
jgi:hypothetical protein